VHVLFQDCGQSSWRCRVFRKAVSVACFLPSLFFWPTYHKAHAVKSASAKKILSIDAICTRFWHPFLQNNQIVDSLQTAYSVGHPELILKISYIHQRDLRLSPANSVALYFTALFPLAFLLYGRNHYSVFSTCAGVTDLFFSHSTVIPIM